MMKLRDSLLFLAAITTTATTLLPLLGLSWAAESDDAVCTTSGESGAAICTGAVVPSNNKVGSPDFPDDRSAAPLVAVEKSDDGVSLLALRSDVRKSTHKKLLLHDTELGPRWAAMLKNRAEMKKSLKGPKRPSQRQVSLVQQERNGNNNNNNLDNLMSRAELAGRGRGSIQLAVKVEASARKKAWIAAQLKMQQEANATGEELEHMAEQIETEQTECSKKTLAMFTKLKDLSEHAQSMSAQLVAHQTVLTTATQDLNNTLQALDDAKEVFHDAVKGCHHERMEAAENFIKYHMELEELRAIAQPTVRADIAEHVIAHISGQQDDAVEDVEVEEDATPLLIQQKSEAFRPSRKKQHQSKHLQGGAIPKGSFSKRQCLAFMRYQAKKRSRADHSQTFGNGTENATTPAANATAADVEACDTKILQLQEEFATAYKNVQDLVDRARVEKDSDKCDKMAKAELDAEVVPLTTQREDATSRIESSEAAAAALRPVIHALQGQMEDMRRISGEMKDECTEMHFMSTHLNAISNLIVGTMDCFSGVEKTLPVPEPKCKTNGLTCTWKCSDQGYIFASGLLYGWLSSDWGAPGENTHQGRAYCERKCIENTHCVAFVHDWEYQGCNFMYDVIDGSFKEAPEFPRKERWACFVEERLHQVNKHREMDHPLLDHNDVEEYWWFYEFYYYGYYDDWDTHGYDYQYYQYHEEGDGESVLDHADPIGDPTQYVGPESDEQNDVQPTEEDVLEVLGDEVQSDELPTNATGAE